MKNDSQKLKELGALALPVMQYMRDNFNPHMSINIDSDRAELLAGHATFWYPAMPPEFGENEHRITAKIFGTIPPLVYPVAPNAKDQRACAPGDSNAH
jgi:hypothetical protein